MFSDMTTVFSQNKLSENQQSLWDPLSNVTACNCHHIWFTGNKPPNVAHTKEKGIRFHLFKGTVSNNLWAYFKFTTP